MMVLVPGGAGYIGSLMVRNLLANGHKPVILDDLSTGNRIAVPDGVKLIEGDIGDETLLDSIFKEHSFDLVMHFAAKIQVGESVRKPGLYYNNNLIKVLTLLNAMVQNDCLKFVFSSTAAIFGSPDYLPVDEKHPTNPINPYGISKLMVEKVLKTFQSGFGLEYVALRYFNAAGAALDGSVGESQKVKQNLIPIVLENLEKGKVSTIFGDDWNTPDGTCIRDYVHVEDIVSAHINALEYLAGGGKSDCFNLGSSSGSSVKEVIETVAKVTGKDIPMEMGPRRDGDPAELVADSKKAKEILNWDPRRSDLEQIVDSAAKWHFNRLY